MKKFNYFFMLLCVACVFGSCAVGSYVPSTLNVGGTSTQVVLSQANFRVVRNIEVVVEINNDHLRRADVEKSAFAELIRRYPLTGSQAYVNVVLEEVRRDKNGGGGWIRKRKQFVAVRATIIEFLQINGEPVKSKKSPYDTTVQKSSQPVNGTSTTSTRTSQDAVKSNTQLTDNCLGQEEMTSAMIEEANMYYIAWLYKTTKLNNSYFGELTKRYDFVEIQSIVHKYSESELLQLSCGHNPNMNKYAK